MTVSEDADAQPVRRGEAASGLEKLLREHTGEQMEVVVKERDEEGTVLEVPREALEALRDVLDILEDGGDVEIVAKDRELTTTEAAEVLNVSRPYLVERLEEGDIPFRKVGSHRRIRLQDVLEYKRAQKEESRRRLEELAAEDERLDIDY